MRHLEEMRPFARFFWSKVHRSQASASWRWALASSAVVCLMPTFGSTMSALVIGMALLAWVYVLLDPARFASMTNAEIAIACTFCAYFGLNLVITQIHENRSSGLERYLPVGP